MDRHSSPIDLLSNEVVPEEEEKKNSLSESGLLVLDGHIAARGRFVLPADVVADLLVLGLLDRALVALIALAHEFLLHEIDACVSHVLKSAFLSKFPFLVFSCSVFFFFFLIFCG